MVPSGLRPAEFRSDSKACLLNEPYPVSCLSRILCSEECNCPTFTCDYSPDYRCSNIGFGNPMASRPCIRFLRKRAKPSGSCARQDHRLCSCRRTPSIRFWDRIVARQRQRVIVIACSRDCRPPRAGESALPPSHHSAHGNMSAPLPCEDSSLACRPPNLCSSAKEMRRMQASPDV
jgi:hypothetical protein